MRQVEAFFDPAGTKLTVRFDDQPTNRGGMNGLGQCDTVLDDATSATLRGSASAPAQCDWSDASTLIAFLTKDTAAGAGMTITTRSNTLWPLGYRGGCGGEGSMCAVSDTISVDAYFPCDTQATPDDLESCITPTALIQAPTEIDSCPGTSFTLDASRSTGGGVRPLEYIWSASPRTCDNYYAVAAALSAAGSAASSVLLNGTALDNGFSFVIVLTVRNFLGRTSEPFTLTVTRASLPVPLIAIQAPPLLALPATARVPLEAQASIADCFASGNSSGAIDFSWSQVASVPSGSTLELDAASRNSRDLYVSGASLAQGIVYTIRATGCMRAQPEVCGAYDTQLTLRNEPLRAHIDGGDRSVGDTDDFTLDACSSSDPDEPAASCDINGVCGALISFVWACVPYNATESPSYASILTFDGTGGACGVEPPANDCEWLFDGGTLTPGEYAFGVRAAKPSGETDDAYVKYVVKAGALPAVSIGALALRKQSPSDKVRLFGVATPPEGVPVDAPLSLQWTVDPPLVDLDTQSSTGSSARSYSPSALTHMTRARARPLPGASFFGTTARRSACVTPLPSAVVRSRPAAGHAQGRADAWRLIHLLALRHVQWADREGNLLGAHEPGALRRRADSRVHEAGAGADDNHRDEGRAVGRRFLR